MKIDLSLLSPNLSDLSALVHRAEALGFDGLWTSEAAHDPFLPLTLAAEHSWRLSLGTAIALAFARSPASLAYIAWDLARFSQGRFILGLGTQVKAHNERRLGVAWERPVDKLREIILAVCAFWDCWQTGAKLNFRGEFFKLTLMPPFFDPGPHDYPNIPIYLAGVNPLMCHLAGELGQGFHVHPLHTVRYLREQIWPAIQQGLEQSGRRRADIELASTVFVIPTDDPDAAHYEQQVRRQIAFYASTPTYRQVLALHGWNDIAGQLSAQAVRRRWDEMSGLVTDELLAAFAVRGRWADLPHLLQVKYGDLLDRVSYYAPFVPGQKDDAWRATIAGFKG
ncbi:MAG: TIGR03617 family F420-dependent LLM class oxidoreductase [Chloroflexota bacterium]